MKNKYFLFITTAILLILPAVNFAQAPALGTASSFALFTSTGAFSNNGASIVTGDIGTNAGAFTGFPPGTVIGQIHVADVISAQAAADVELAYNAFSTITCGAVIGTNLGNGQLLRPNVYCLGAASTLNGALILDGQGDPNALFIFKIDGALSTTTLSSVTLINAASLCNVYWQINGQVQLGDNSVFRGTIVANGAIILLNGASLLGRGLSRAGAISLNNNVVTRGLNATASIISANGATKFCTGDSVILSGNNGGTWSTGASTASITVKSSGDYFVTNTTGCGSATSNHIIVTVNPVPVCFINSWSNFICTGQTVKLFAPTPPQGTVYTYRWSNNATTNCISVSAAGTYTLTVTGPGGCSSTCSKTIKAVAPPPCTISSTSNTILPGQTLSLSAPSGVGYTYRWSNNATSRSISVTAAGTYTVTVKNCNGCISTCSKTITNYVAPLPAQRSLPKNTIAMQRQLLLSSGSLEAQAFPNPFVSTTTIEFLSHEDVAQAVVEIFDVNGKKVALLFNGKLLANQFTKVSFDGAGVPKGVYFYRISSGDGSLNGRLVLTK